MREIRIEPDAEMTEDGAIPFTLPPLPADLKPGDEVTLRLDGDPPKPVLTFD